MSILGQPVTALATHGFVGMPYPRPIVIPIEFLLQVAGILQPQGFVVTSNFCQVANAGIQFIAQVLDESLNTLDIYGATSLTIAFQKPDGTQFAKTANYLTNGIDGKIYYVTTATDILEAGLWYLQAQIVIGGATLTTMWGQFQANPNL